MNKKEKLVATFLIFSFTLLISSSIYTLYQLKPKGYSFKFEKIYKNKSK